MNERSGSAGRLVAAGRQCPSAPSGNLREDPTTQRPSPATPSSLTPPSSGKRDYRLDFLRGFAVFIMVVDHAAGPSPLHLITGGNRFFVSAAEGFVFISGFLVGIVYGGKARRYGWRFAARQALGRAFTLYAVTIWLTLAFALLSALFGLRWAPDPWQTTVGQFLLETLTFQRTYFLVDVMQLYTLLMAVTAPILLLLYRGRWWWLLTLSVGIWLTFQLSHGQNVLPWPFRDNPVFPFASWQLLFFTGVVLGYERAMFRRVRTRWLQPICARLPGGWLPLLTVLVGLMIWLHVTGGAVLQVLGLTSDPLATLDAWIDKSRLPPLRLVSCAILFAFAWVVVDRGWRILARVSGWLLLPIGMRALYAYVTHVFIVAVLGVLVIAPDAGTKPVFQLGWPPAITNASSQILAVLAVWLIVKASVPQRMVAWLGRPPLRIASPVSDPVPGGRWQAAPSLGALAALVAGSVLALGTPWPSGLSQSVEPVHESPSQPVTHIEAPASPKRRLADLRPSLDGSPNGDQPPSVLLDRTFYSGALGREMPYGIYLPPGYQEDASRRYPVLYLLHGAPTNYSEWAQLGLADVADDMIVKRQIDPFIVVFVEGEGSYYFNHPDGPAWGDYVARDLVQHIDQTERTLPDPARRAIGGLSMGGHGALQLAFNYPDVFGIVGAHAPALRTGDDQLPEFFGSPDDYARYDPLVLARTVDRRPLVTWLDVPSRDPWLERADELRQALEYRDWPLVYKVYPGEHNAVYWPAHIPDYLAFYSEALGDESAVASVVGEEVGALYAP